jgi:hypothetical protein
MIYLSIKLINAKKKKQQLDGLMAKFSHELLKLW